MSEDLSGAKFDRLKINQVLTNLIGNAIKFTPEKGRVSINVQRRNEELIISVSDTGIGIPKEALAKIFECFYTVNQRGKQIQGTGLGLATVHGIIRQSEGFVWVYSELGRGTTFKIYLPEAQEKVEEQGMASAPSASWQGQETVLVVEDEELVRRVARRILQHYGYTILEASTGKEALVIGEQYPGPIHLLLTDVMMPEMGGKELVNHWKDQHPETKVIFTSGYTENAIVHNGTLDPNIHFIQKPYRPDALARMVREVLDEHFRQGQHNYWGEL